METPLFTLQELQQSYHSTAKYNLFNNYDETLQVMATIEGGGILLQSWMDHQKKDGAQLTVGAAMAEAVAYLKRLENYYWKEINWSDDENVEWLMDRFIYANYWGSIVYGSGGFNRYLVTYNGDVKFSLYHGMPGTIKQAEAFGFPFF